MNSRVLITKMDWALRIILGCIGTFSASVLWYWSSFWTLPLIAITLGSLCALVGLYLYDRADDRATGAIAAMTARKDIEVAAQMLAIRDEVQERLQIELAPFKRKHGPDGLFVPDPPEVKAARAEVRRASRKLLKVQKVAEMIVRDESFTD